MGVTPPAFPPDELEQLETAETDTYEFDGKEYTLYELRQLQNKWERQVKLLQQIVAGLETAIDAGDKRKDQYKQALEMRSRQLATWSAKYNSLSEFIDSITNGNLDTQTPESESESENSLIPPVPKYKVVSTDDGYQPSKDLDNNYTLGEKYLSYYIDSLNQSIIDNNRDPSLEWDQTKIDKVWATCDELYDQYDIYIDPCLLLAIIFKEGTGSWDTSSENQAQGGNGIELDFDVDLYKASYFLLGKILGYAYYGDDFSSATTDAANSGKYGIDGKGDLFQYMNWLTPIIRIDPDTNTTTVDSGVYSTYSLWYSENGGVEQIYEQLSVSDDENWHNFNHVNSYDDYANLISKETVIDLTKNITFPSFEFKLHYNSTLDNKTYIGYTISVR